VPLERTPELVGKLLRAHPEARAAYTGNLETGPEMPARVSWTTGTRRAPTYSLGEIEASTGEILEDDYLPGRQGGWFATVTSFFALHFDSLGGAPVR
jgi:hypothetical protein